MACNCLGVVWDDGRALAAALIHYYYLLFTFYRRYSDVTSRCHGVASRYQIVVPTMLGDPRTFYCSTIFSLDTFSMAQSGSQGVPLRPLVALEVAGQRVLGSPDSNTGK